LCQPHADDRYSITSLLTCSECDATAHELAGLSTTQNPPVEWLLNEAGLRPRSDGRLLCEECRRLLMRKA
jgi:hypothetical protein